MQPSSPHHRAGLLAPLLEKGDLVAGKYRVERVIGAGGMAQVVAARHVELGNLFAIKVLRPSDDGDDSATVRFMREAQVIARLRNDHVVRIHDVGQTDRGLAYIVMEHLDGQDLGSLLAARGPLPVDEAVGAILEACDGLAEAHEMGIVHRDLKPANLFLARKSADGAAAVKVVDFGLAKAEKTAHPNSDRILSAKATATGEIVGTGGYMAPEQIGGEATPRSDVWSLGVTLYRLLTGKHPFAGKNAVELSLAALTGDMRPLVYFRSDVPAAIEAVIARCLRRIPEERYANARVLGDALLDAFASARAMPPPSSPARVTPPSATSIVTAARPEDTATYVLPPRSQPPVSVRATTPTSFTTSEAGLDVKSRTVLLGSAIAVTTATLFLLAAIVWRRSAEEGHREQAATVQEPLPPAPGFPPPPVRPTQAEPPAAGFPPPPPLPVLVESAPPATLETSPPLAPTPEPVLVAPEPAASASTPPPVPVAAPVAAAPRPAAAPAAAPRAPAKKKALYDTP